MRMGSLPTQVSLPTRALPRHDVEIIDDAFAPGTVTVKRGATVAWLNRGGKVHDVFSSTAEWPAEPIRAGTTWTRVFPQAGTFPYICQYHPVMRGEIVVE